LFAFCFFTHALKPEEESTNELDDIDRIKGKSFENSAELEQWRTNCLHLQEKVKVLEGRKE